MKFYRYYYLDFANENISRLFLCAISSFIFSDQCILVQGRWRDYLICRNLHKFS